MRYGWSKEEWEEMRKRALIHNCNNAQKHSCRPRSLEQQQQQQQQQQQAAAAAAAMLAIKIVCANV